MANGHHTSLHAAPTLGAQTCSAEALQILGMLDGTGAPDAVDTHTGARSTATEQWARQLRVQHAPLIGYVAADASRLAERNRESGFDVVGSAEDAAFVSTSLARILDVCYGGTFPIRQFTDPNFIRAQIDARMITSFVLREVQSGEPIGTSSLRHMNTDEWTEAYASGGPIAVELARSASLPNSLAATTELMQARQRHLFETDSLVATHAYVFGDARASATRALPSGEILQGGARTQHSIVKNGLRPMALHANYDFRGLHEPMMHYQLAFDATGQQEYLRQHPIYLPANAEGLMQFVTDCMDLAGLRARIVVGEGGRFDDTSLDIKDNGAYLEASISSGTSGYQVGDAASLVDMPDQPNAIMVKVSATEDRLALMDRLIGEGFTATGILPGTSTQLVSPDGRLVPYIRQTHVIFVKNRRGILVDAPELELPRDMDEHPITRSSRHLWRVMRERNG